jgi:hypothetical protein
LEEDWKGKVGGGSGSGRGGRILGISKWVIELRLLGKAQSVRREQFSSQNSGAESLGLGVKGQKPHLTPYVSCHVNGKKPVNHPMG